MVDWFSTRERAIEHALDAAQEHDVAEVAVERPDGSVEETISVRARRLTRVARAVAHARAEANARSAATIRWTDA